MNRLYRAVFAFSYCLRFWVGGFSGRFQVFLAMPLPAIGKRGGVAAEEDAADASK
nr:MAG TPA: hypothetical protein [Caudoviricetes sp.]